MILATRFPVSFFVVTALNLTTVSGVVAGQDSLANGGFEAGFDSWRVAHAGHDDPDASYTVTAERAVDLIGKRAWDRLPACQDPLTSIAKCTQASQLTGWKPIPRLNQQAARWQGADRTVWRTAKRPVPIGTRIATR